ncbi:hypothetical protein LWI28_017007 [Acer negundo]|uniref:Integrase catalytic domain-containing protein n=1 Tax=Acer negundo TaxID=4023 RepID=A0AAD5IQH7_ACENE|nr:hypothetical protein LWI28_017007 [Acer negundo]
MQFDAQTVEICKKLEDHEGGVERFLYKNGLLYYKNYVYVSGVPGLREEILAHFHNSKEREGEVLLEAPYGVVATIIDTEENLGGLDNGLCRGLPSSGGYESILVVVDRLSKGAHFIPLRHHFTTSSVAKAFVDNVVKLHRIPSSIVTDRGKLFMSSFWHELFTLQGSKLKVSSSYHP